MHVADEGRTERVHRAGCHLDCIARAVHRGRRPGIFHHYQGTLELKTEAPSIMRSQWFVIHTLSGQEQKVKESIEKRIKPEEMGEYIREVLVPMEKVVE